MESQGKNLRQVRPLFGSSRGTCSSGCERSCAHAANDERVEVGCESLKFLVRQAGQEGAKSEQHFFRNQIKVVEAEIEVVPNSIGAGSGPQGTAIGLPELCRKRFHCAPQNPHMK